MSNESTSTARGLIDLLRGMGIRDLVLAPGSRNAPLGLAAFDADRAGVVALHTRIDERTAGFLALGLTRVGRRAAVICTSGTAVANLHPAVMEAAHSGLGVVFVTADRPERMRGTGASQTTDQWEVFTPHARTHVVRGVEDVAPLANLLPGRMPAHVDVHLDEPLLPTDRWDPPPMEVRVPRSGPPAAQPVPLPVDPRRTVVVAGDDAGPPARVLAERAGWPLLAEPTSGSRTGANAIRTYRLLLESELGRQVERVVVQGHPTLSRPVLRLLGRDDVEVVSVRTPTFWSERPFAVDLDVAAHDVLALEGEVPSERDWLDAWLDADRATGRRLDALLAGEPDLTPHEVAGAVSRALPPGGLLHVGASSPIRDLDIMVATYAVGDRRKVIANRGLAGIDGTISSAIGAAVGRPRSSRALALMGDVTFLHDMTGLVLGPREARPDLTIVVVNDDGGSIFTMLEQGADSYADAYDTVFGTPHGVDIASLCAAARVPHLAVTSLPELEQALAMPNGGIEVVEVRVRRDNRRDLDERIRALTP